MALAIERHNLFFPLPLNNKEERFLLEFIKEYIEFYEKRKVKKIFSKLFEKQRLYEALNIFVKLSRLDPYFESSAKILNDLYFSLYGRHGHFNEYRLEMYLKQLFQEFIEIEKRLFSIQKI